VEKEKTILKATNLCGEEKLKYDFAIQTNLRMDTTSWAWEHKFGYMGEVRFFYVTPQDIENLAQSLMDIIKSIPNRQKEKLVLSDNKFKGIYAGKEFPEMLEIPQKGFKDSEVNEKWGESNEKRGI
jgi:hypothetical protein